MIYCRVFLICRPAKSQAKTSLLPNILSLKSQPRNETESGSKRQHSFSLEQLHLSPHFSVLQCRRVQKAMHKKERRRGQTG